MIMCHGQLTNAYRTTGHIGNRIRALTTMLPLFREIEKTSAMISHYMYTIKYSTENLNPGQTPIRTFDQLLFALRKLLQWSPNSECNETNFLSILEVFILRFIAENLIGNW